MIEKLLELDGNILLWIQNNLRNFVTDPIMKFITTLGDGGLLWIAVCIALLIIPKTRTLGLYCSISLAMAFIVTNLVIKNAVARTRPYEVVDGLSRLVGEQHDYSFPSGHANASFAVAVVIFKRCCKKIGVPVLILAILISLSRLYVGVHYPSDVVAGAVIGTVFALISCAIWNYAIKRKNAKLQANAEE